MTLAEIERQVFSVALSSPICGVPAVRRLTPTSISLRVGISTGGFIDVFYNEQSGTTAFALIREGSRVFGVDNTGGWHLHRFADPDSHTPLTDEMSFQDFVAEIERHEEPPSEW